VQNSFRKGFPATEMKGCFFHLSQSTYRKVKDLGLQTRYRDDYEFAVSVQMIAALAFVPISEVHSAFTAVVAKLTDNVFGLIITYFEDNYIGRMRGSRRVPCNFPPRV
jgi:hypothetical protein